MHATALIAEDEPLLAQALTKALAAAWPQLEVVATVGDGVSAEEQALTLKPDILFFDIQMPGQSGIEAALALADQWEIPSAATGPGHKPFPCLVFVTAYDRYAVEAFEAQAMDYLLKPVMPERLAKTLAKLKAHLLLVAGHVPTQDDAMALVIAQLRALVPEPSMVVAPRPTAALQFIQASQGNTIQMVAVGDIEMFQALDKYVQISTAHTNYLIRTPLKELMAQLPPDQFWQIHRGAVVRVDRIDKVTRDEAGKTYLHLKGRSDALVVSRLYTHLFKAM
jgi:DNA-binding LytR/AlgR family response regulator